MERLHQSIVKPDNDIFDNGVTRLNEDEIIIRNNLVGLSDGAGGVGLFAKEWAKTLVSHLPDEPMKSIHQLEEWIGTFWEEFYNQHLLEASKDPFLARKYDDEGSLATLCALWFSEKKVEYLVYGDSMVFHYSHRTGVLTNQDYFDELQTFNQSPYLLNWKDEVIRPLSFESSSWTLEEGDVVLCASDALAQYIYMTFQSTTQKGRNDLQKQIDAKTRLSEYASNILSNKDLSFDSFLDDLMTGLSSYSNFEKKLYSAYEKGTIARDDYSLILIEV